MTDEISDLGYHARVYALAGIKVFPLWGIVEGTDGLRCSCRAAYECTSPGKHPRFAPAHNQEDIRRNGKCYGKCGKVGHGLYDATDNVDIITRWWNEDPRCGIGQPAQGNGYGIVDVDPKSGGDESFERLHTVVLERSGVDLMDTLIQNTGKHNGRRGMHLLYAAPEGGVPSKGKVFGGDMPGLDTRGVGGYTVTWPTLHISGVEYEYLDWLVEPAPWPSILTALMNPPKTVIPIRQHRERTSNPTGYAEAALTKELDILRATKVGGRNDALNVAAFNLGQLVGGRVLSETTVQDELLAAATSIGLGTIESLKTINSGLLSGMASPRQGGRAA